MSGGNYKDNTFSPFKSMVTFVINLIDADYLKVAYLCHMATKNLVDIDSDVVLLSDGTKPFLETMLTWYYFYPSQCNLTEIA